MISSSYELKSKIRIYVLMKTLLDTNKLINTSENLILKNLNKVIFEISLKL